MVSEPLFAKGLYDAACKKGLIRKEQFPTIDWDGEHDPTMVAAFVLEDRGISGDLDDVINKADQETKLPPLISGIAIHFANRYTDKIHRR